MAARSFSSPAAFVAFLASVPARLDRANRQAMEKAARLVEREAKASIGEYQPAAGPFARWTELADTTKADRLRQGFTENDPLLRSGALRASIEHQVETTRSGAEAAIGSNSQVAVFQEIGTVSIPPRSFLGSAAVRNADRIVEILGDDAVAALTGSNGSRTDIPLP